jgi:transcription initiation factor TFIIB
MIHDSGEVVCTDCGFVVDRVMDSGPESHAYTPEEAQRQARTGAPVTLRLSDHGMTTVIGGGRPSLSDEKWREVNALRKWQRRVRVSDATERNLAVALSELSKLAAALSLPSNILDTAAVIYRRAIKKRMIRGRSIANIVGASLYLSCRQCGVPRSLDEIAVLAMTSKKELGRSFRFMLRQLDIVAPPSQNANYAARFSNRLAISGKAEGIAIRILEIARQMKLTSGRGPAGIAAASTYIATVLTNERKTQREIAEIANVTEVTIRNRYKALLEKLTLIVPL